MQVTYSQYCVMTIYNKLISMKTLIYDLIFINVSHLLFRRNTIKLCVNNRNKNVKRYTFQHELLLTLRRY